MSRIKELRQSAGLTQKALAEKVGIAQPYLCELEKGGKNGSLDTMVKIANALGVTVDSLIGG